MNIFTSKGKNPEAGFSLVELMVVVAIIGILSSIAFPRFRTFQAKARQAEAKTNLSHIYTLEQSFFGDNDAYTAMALQGFNNTAAGSCSANTLGFQLDPCGKARYAYTVVSTGGTLFTGTAASGAGAVNKILPGCAADSWTITQDKVIAATNDVTKTCN